MSIYLKSSSLKVLQAEEKRVQFGLKKYVSLVFKFIFRSNNDLA